MQQVTILGSATLLGQHLTKVFREQHPEIKVKLWDCSADGELDGLAEALKDTDTVFNLHEVQDFSLVPNTSALQKHNVDFVTKLIDGCKTANSASMLLVHLSSVYLQCSTKWPNVYGSEQEDFDTAYRKQCPFPEYCQSKFEAEKLIRSADTIGRVIARVGPLYGEGDCHSLVCDFILATQALGSVPRVGDSSKSMGVLQFTYVANAAHALLACAQKLPELAAAIDNEQHQQPCETVLISDHTPVRDFYSLMLEPLMEEEEKVVETKEEEEEEKNKAAGEQGVVQPVIDDQDQLKEKEKDQEESSPAESTSTTSTITTVVESKVGMVNGKGSPPPSMDNNNKKKRNIIRLTGWRVPFLLFYLPYALLCALIRLFCHAIGANSDSSVMGKLPSPNLVYLLLRHWSFYSERKLRLLFDFRPPFDWSTSMQRSRAHYRQLKPEQIRGPSWLPAFVDRRRRPVEDGKAKADDE